MTSAIVVIPWREEDSRREGFEVVKHVWEDPQWYPIFITDSSPDLPFNRSEARNNGVRLAATIEMDWDVAIFADACILPSVSRVREAVEVARETGYFVQPFSQMLWMRNGAKTRERTDPVPGGVVVVPRRLYETVGGYDERFIGWGGEDNAFAWACATMAGRTRLEGSAVHMYHVKSEKAADPSSLHLLGEYQRARGDQKQMMRLITRTAQGSSLPPTERAVPGFSTPSIPG